ncbi:MAG: choice-of-anchor P family protein [Euzebya sp.]
MNKIISTRFGTARSLWIVFIFGAALLGVVAPRAGAQGPDPVEATLSDAFGLEAAVALGGTEVVRIDPTPFLQLSLPPPETGSASDSLISTGPIGDEPSLGSVGVAELEVEGLLGADGFARASAEVADVDLLVPDPITGPLITADAIRSVSTTICDVQTLDEASSGSMFVGLSIGGEPIPVDVPANTEIVIPGVARVIVKQVIPDTDGLGFTVRGLVVQTIDPLSGALGVEAVVAEAHSSVVCGGDGGPPIPEPTTIEVTKDVAGTTSVAAPGDEVTYDIVITNVTTMDCTLTRVTDTLPEGFEFVSLGGDLADATTSVVDGRLIAELSLPLDAGASVTGQLVLKLPEDAVPGTYFNDVRVTTTCGIGRTGLTAPVTVPEPDAESPCPVRPNVVRFAGASPSPGSDSDSNFSGQTDRSGSTPRVFGQDRTETTVRLSEAVFDFADAAIVARNDLFPDALAASGLAAEICGPLLLTPPNSLAPSIKGELDRLGVSTVYIVGGVTAVDPSIEQALTEEGYDLIRLGGTGRHETARLIALEIVDLGGPVAKATIVRADIFPDALSGANLATWGRAPILLTDTDRLNPPTSQALTEILGSGSNDLYIAGGLSAVSAPVEAELVSDGYDITRLAGPERYATSIAVHAEAVRLGAGLSRMWVASGADFPDALTGGIASFVDSSALTLVAPDTLDSSPASRDYIDSLKGDIDTAVIVGGPAAISNQVEEELRAILGG